LIIKAISGDLFVLLSYNFEGFGLCKVFYSQQNGGRERVDRNGFGECCLIECEAILKNDLVGGLVDEGDA